MPLDWKNIKKVNSKGELISHIKTLHMALEWYARPENWKRINESIAWIGDDDPRYAALVVLGRRKPDPQYLNNWQKAAERRKHGHAGTEETQPRDRRRDEILERPTESDDGSEVRR